MIKAAVIGRITNVAPRNKLPIKLDKDAVINVKNFKSNR